MYVFNFWLICPCMLTIIAKVVIAFFFVLQLIFRHYLVEWMSAFQKYFVFIVFGLISLLPSYTFLTVCINDNLNWVVNRFKQLDGTICQWVTKKHDHPAKNLKSKLKKQILKRHLENARYASNKTQIETVNFRLYFKVIIRQNHVFFRNLRFTGETCLFHVK